ncbi:MAG: hypothetical protein ACK5LS_06080 [Propioniciclava sp.]
MLGIALALALPIGAWFVAAGHGIEIVQALVETGGSFNTNSERKQRIHTGPAPSPPLPGETPGPSP